MQQLSLYLNAENTTGSHYVRHPHLSFTNNLQIIYK
jgi:hypothetical protein